MADRYARMLHEKGKVLDLAAVLTDYRRLSVCPALPCILQRMEQPDPVHGAPAGTPYRSLEVGRLVGLTGVLVGRVAAFGCGDPAELDWLQHAYNGERPLHLRKGGGALAV